MLRLNTITNLNKKMKQYQPLYLKYRPQKLSELVGQEIVSKTLTNAMQYNKIVHAYLFCGPRGTGKTSTARILAKSLNCEKGVTIEPCEKCISCMSITQGNSLDVIEIDAASHRKVEDAEDLISRVNLGTYGSRYKIYIIDEVHMLTDHAFNALLKTLEEPPKNVLFILATTEEYKIIPTIISRCQKLDFKVIPESDLNKRISYIAKTEKININDQIIKFITKKANGCLRDAVSLLDQISVLQEEEKPIEQKEVYELFGSVDKQTLFKLFHAIALFDKKQAIDISENLVKTGKDISEILKALLELIIELVKAKLDSNHKTELTNEIGENLDVLNKIEQSHLLKMIDSLQDAQQKLRFALSQELQFMVEIMTLLDEDFLISITNLKERIKNLESGVGLQNSPTKVQNKVLPEFIKEEKTLLPVINQPHVSKQQEKDATGIQSSDLDLTWSKIVNSIDSNPTKTLLTQSDSYLIKLSEELVEIGLSKSMFLPRLDKDEKKQEMILKAIKTICGFTSAKLKFSAIPRTNINKIVLEPEQRQSVNQSTDSPVNADIEVKPDFLKSRVPHDADETTRAIIDLLGAKSID